MYHEIGKKCWPQNLGVSAKRLNQSTNLISKSFCKTEANSVSQRETQ